MLSKSTKCGNSNRFHRVHLMEQVLTILPVAHLCALTINLEFKGSSWLAWLRLIKVSHGVRVKANT